MDELLGNTARLAGVAGRDARREERRQSGTREEGEGYHVRRLFWPGAQRGEEEGIVGAKGLEADELSEEEEDIFNEMERGEMEGDDDDDEEEEDGGLEDEDALRKELEQELADELAVDEEEDDDDGAFRVPDEEAGAEGQRWLPRPIQRRCGGMRRTRRQQPPPLWLGERLRALGVSARAGRARAADQDAGGEGASGEDVAAEGRGKRQGPSENSVSRRTSSLTTRRRAAAHSERGDDCATGGCHQGEDRRAEVRRRRARRADARQSLESRRAKGSRSSTTKSPSAVLATSTRTSS